MRYDLLVIGSGPAGQKGAIAAAKLNKKVAIIERNQVSMGGVCLHKGTIPSKTMREAILHLSGYRQRDVYGDRYRRKRTIRMSEIRKKVAQVTDHELQVIQDQLQRNGVDIYSGEASFLSPHEVQVTQTGEKITLSADLLLIGSGTKPSRPDHIPFDGECIFDSDDILTLKEIPRSMIVVGGGVIGVEYAIMFAILGVQVTVVDQRENLLGFCDQEIVDMLMYQARSLGMVFRLGEQVTAIDRLKHGMAVIHLESGKRLVSETVLFSVGRVGDSENLNLKSAGLEPDERGRLWCNENHQTWSKHIYGVGDIVGFPALASVAVEQGRRAVCHAFGEQFEPCKQMPYGLFTIPEISMVGKNERELTKEKVPYEVGVSRFSEISRGTISGDPVGMLKILFHRETNKILGVHCIGETATEIVHIGQAVMAFDGTLEYFRDNVFNYPTMSECYRVAAFDGLNKMNIDRMIQLDTVAEELWEEDRAASELSMKEEAAAEISVSP